MKNLILAIAAVFTIVGTAYAESPTINVESSVFGLNWKDGNRFVIEWDDGCRIYNNSIMPKQICKDPAFFFQDGYNRISKLDTWRSSKTRYPVTKLWINGVRIKPRAFKDSTYYKSDDQIAQIRLRNNYLDGEPLIAKFLIYKDQQESFERTVILEANADVFQEYLAIKDYLFNEAKNKTIRTYFFWLIGIIGCAVGLLILRKFSIKAWVAANEKGRSLARRSKEKKHEALVQKITEEETIRKEVRKNLEAEDKE